MKAAKTILDQLGGNKFIAMTGSKNFLYTENSLSMDVARNRTRANRLKITLNDSDLYDMEFVRYVMPKLDVNKGTFSGGGINKIAKIDGVYFDDLQRVFTSVTGLDTGLCER